jgi:hypothetical protein
MPAPPPESEPAIDSAIAGTCAGAHRAGGGGAAGSDATRRLKAW